MINLKIITTGHFVDSYGGVEKVLCNMANELTDRGYHIEIIYYNSKDGKPVFPLYNNIKLTNTYNNKVPRKISRIFSPILNFSLKKEVRHRKRNQFNIIKKTEKISLSLTQENTDIVIAFQPDAAVIARKILGKNTPIISMFHGKISLFKSTLLDYKEILETINHFTVLLPPYIKDLNKYIENKNISAIPNLVPQFPYTTEYNNQKIINVSRLDKEKRIPLLIKSFAIIKKKHPSWILEHWGPICNQKIFHEISNFIKENNLEDSIKFQGTSAHIEDPLSKASIFAFPSEFEGFPLAMTEAMSMGLPTIGCTDCTGVNFLIKNGGNGLLTSPTPEAFAEGLEQLIRSIEFRKKLGHQAKEDMKQYAPEKVWEQWDDLIRKCLPQTKE